VRFSCYRYVVPVQHIKEGLIIFPNQTVCYHIFSILSPKYLTCISGLLEGCLLEQGPESVIDLANYRNIMFNEKFKIINKSI
jgi:hypothetical protein